MRLLLQAQVKATKAEATIGNIQDIMREHTSQSLIANGFYSATTSNTSALSSQAEQTMKSHSSNTFAQVAHLDGNLAVVLDVLTGRVPGRLVKM